jgi:hypothetical protein
MDSFWSGLFNRLGRVNWLAKIRTTQLYHDTPKVINRYALCIFIRDIIHFKKKLFDIPVPCRDVTYQTLPGQEKFIYDVIIPAQGEFGK